MLFTSEVFLKLDRLLARIVLVGGGHNEASDRLIDPLHGRPRAHVNAQFAELLHEPTHQIWIECREHPLGALEYRDMDAGPSCDVREFGGDVQSVSNPKVYAAGDAASGGPPLTPVSGHDGKVVAQNLLDGNRHRPDYRGVPSVAFTIPPIAAVGLSEAEARAKGLKFRMHSEKAPDWYTALRLNESVYGFKTLVEEDTDRILGAHLVGPHADEVINLFGLAIRHGLTTKDLKTTMFAYPTGASDIGYML